MKRILRARAQEENFAKMLVNEAKLTVQLTHSNIAQIYECGIIDGDYFISMELVNGVSMKEMMHAVRAGRRHALARAVDLPRAAAPAGALVRAPEDRRQREPAQDRPLRRLARQLPRLVGGRGEAARLRDRARRRRVEALQLQGGHADGEARVRRARAGLAREALGPPRRRLRRRASSCTSCSRSRSRSRRRPTSSRSSSRGARRWSRPPRSSRGCRRTSTRSSRRRSPTSRRTATSTRARFADALVDVLFPTPHSSIQDHLAPADEAGVRGEDREAAPGPRRTTRSS